ncbi:MAG: NADH-quinone oxidoreductase subunit N [Bdellovibrionota bacterium]
MLNTINAANLVLSQAQWLALGPYVIMTVGILLSMLLCTVHFGDGPGKKLPLMLFSALTLALAGIWTGMHWVVEPVHAFGGAVVFDYMSSFFTVLLCGATLLVMLGSYSYLEHSEIHFAEFYPILLASTLGMMLLSCSEELLMLFVALELMSLMVYVLVGMRRMNAFSNEASVKYFVMGGASAAIYLYGMALVYGALNTTRLVDISKALSAQPDAFSNPILIAGFVFLIVGFLFKVAAAPFHMWTPDVYEGAPTNITSYMATALKAAVFAALIRVVNSFWGDHLAAVATDTGAHVAAFHLVHRILWVIALATMLIGNFVALMQSNLKRLMAYSAIAHTGYLIVGLMAGPHVGYSGILFYLVAYTAMNIGAFTLMSLFAGKSDGALTTQGLAGLAKRHPWAAASLTIFLLSLGGFPPTAGFVGKYYLFSGALEAGETWLVLIAVLTSAVSVYYYLRLVVLMYMSEGTEPGLNFRKSNFAYLAVAICIFLTINYGLFPGALIQAAKKAAVFL